VVMDDRGEPLIPLQASPSDVFCIHGAIRRYGEIREREPIRARNIVERVARNESVSFDGNDARSVVRFNDPAWPVHAPPHLLRYVGRIQHH